MFGFVVVAMGVVSIYAIITQPIAICTWRMLFPPAAVAMLAEARRALRFINVAFGASLIVLPWVLEGASTTVCWVGILTGLAVIALSLPRGRRGAEHNGSWDGSLYEQMPTAGRVRWNNGAQWAYPSRMTPRADGTMPSWA